MSPAVQHGFTFNVVHTPNTYGNIRHICAGTGNAADPTLKFSELRVTGKELADTAHPEAGRERELYLQSQTVMVVFEW
jgi:hypothetical protein